jgi:pteridine reductase
LKNEPLRVLVTGGGVRLGRALALAFAAEGGPGGVAVAVHHRSSAGPAAAVVAQIEAAGGRAVALQADLSTASGCAALAAQTEAALGGLDVLINSAADYAAVPFAQLTPEAWDAMQALNTRAPFLLTQALLPALQASGRPGGGCVINLTDIAADRPVPGFAHYCVSKAGLTALTRALALELAPAVRVNAIAPGTVLAPEHLAEATLAAILATIPLGRFGSPDDIVQAALYLALRAPYVTGQILAVDGGRAVGGPMVAG